jgi:hypothetical protein
MLGFEVNNHASLIVVFHWLCKSRGFMPWSGNEFVEFETNTRLDFSCGKAARSVWWRDTVFWANSAFPLGQGLPWLESLDVG